MYKKKSYWMILFVSIFFFYGTSVHVFGAPPKQLQKFKMGVSSYDRGREVRPNPVFSNGMNSYRAMRSRLIDGRTGKKITWIFTESPFHGKIIYDNFTTNNIVPLFGYLYRVTGPLADDLKWLPSSNQPNGIGIQYDSIVLSLGGSYETWGVSRHGKITLSGLKIQKNKRNQIIASLYLDQHDNVHGYNPKKIEIQKGQVLSIHKDKYRIRNIVPRSKKTGAIGWVELSPVRREHRPAVVVRGNGTITIRTATKADQLKSPQAWIGTNFKGKNGKLWMSGVWTLGVGSEPQELYKKLGTRKSDYETLDSFRVGGSPLTVGDLLPLYGEIYRVSSITKETTVFRLATNKELPAGTKPKKGTIVVPIRRARGGHPQLTPRLILPDGTPYMYGAIHPSGTPVAGMYSHPKSCFDGCPAKIGQGYGLGIGISVKPIRVVLPDDKKGIMGWIELEPIK